MKRLKTYVTHLISILQIDMVKPIECVLVCLCDYPVCCIRVSAFSFVSSIFPTCVHLKIINLGARKLAPVCCSNHCLACYAVTPLQII